MEQDKFYPALMNFFVWGLGFIVLKKYKIAAFWMAAYASLQAGMFMFGWTYLFILLPGRLILLGCILISISLATQTYRD